MLSATLVATIIAFVVLISLWITCIIPILKQFYCVQILHKQRTINKWLKFYCTGYLIFYFVATILAFILLLLSLNVELFRAGNKGFTIMIISILICASFGFFAFYMFLILRLYKLFATTTYEVSKTKMHTFMILSCLCAIIFCVYGCTYYLFKDSVLFTNVWLKWTLISIVFCAIIINLIIATSLVYTLCVRLVRLTVKSVLNQQIESDKMPRRKSVLSRHDTKLLSIVTREAILGAIAIFMFNIAIPIDLILYAWVYPQNEWTYVLTVYVACLCNAIQMICVVLLFNFNAKYYNILCKKLCHNFCENCCIAAFTQKQIRNESMKRWTTIFDGVPLEMHDTSNANCAVSKLSVATNLNIPSKQNHIKMTTPTSTLCQSDGEFPDTQVSIDIDVVGKGMEPVRTVSVQDSDEENTENNLPLDITAVGDIMPMDNRWTSTHL